MMMMMMMMMILMLMLMLMLMMMIYLKFWTHAVLTNIFYSLWFIAIAVIFTRIANTFFLQEPF